MERARNRGHKGHEGHEGEEGHEPPAIASGDSVHTPTGTVCGCKHRTVRYTTKNFHLDFIPMHLLHQSNYSTDSQPTWRLVWRARSRRSPL